MAQNTQPLSDAQIQAFNDAIRILTSTYEKSSSWAVAQLSLWKESPRLRAVPPERRGALCPTVPAERASCGMAGNPPCSLGSEVMACAPMGETFAVTWAPHRSGPCFSIALA